ncbi:heparinase II/III-family protein [Streptomyces sp. NBC_01619]|uniref:heparinase II/III domain-containing protein n=1 Tax=Streptomyces sp. NBC_01619 TaxID=2975901 RepID=UPI00225B76AB|nr:heparinase II/III family protein [Streptomyces sp. NBC_01619]MCX4515400.1 heparinase II/III-family protein [Streptomyces sp. NBC_01619]
MIRYSRSALRAAFATPVNRAVPKPLTGPHLDALWAEIRAEASRGADTATPSWSRFHSFEADGDRVPYERVYFGRRGRLNALAAGAWLDGEPAGLAALADMVWSVCEEYTWAVPAHSYLVTSTDRPMEQCVDLFAAETAHTVAEIVTLLGGRLPSAVTDRARAEVRRRVLTPLFGSDQPWSWETTANNWSAVCAGAAGMAALALVDDPDELTAAIERCLRVMDVYLSGLGADGSCVEGVNYWAYGFGYFTYFAEALRERTGVDLLRDLPQATAAAAFPAAVETGGGRFVTFADAVDSMPLPAGIVSRLRERLGSPVPGAACVPSFDADHCHRWAHLSRTLTWTDPAVLDSPTTDAVAWLPDAAWLVDRRTVEDIQITFAAKGGHNDESHNHNDLGQFTLSADGEELLADLGAGSYSHGYFGPDRYTAHLHPSARAHSVPVVDGVAQEAGRHAEAVVLAARADESGSVLRLDLAAAYAGRPVVRSFAWHPDARLVVHDTFDGATQVEEIFISRLRPRLADGAATWSGTRAAATLAYDETAWKPDVERIETTDHFDRPETVYRLRLRSVGRPAAVFELTVRPV